MRTTIRLSETLLQQAKKFALEHKCTLTSLIEDSLRITLSRKDSLGKKRRVKLPSSGSGGVLPGVDLDNSASLLDIMEGIR